MTSIAQVSEAMQQVLMHRAKEVERSTGFVQRSTARLDGPVFVQMATLTWMHQSRAGYADLQHTAASLGVNVSVQAIEQRFGPASVALMREGWQAGVAQLISSEPMSVELLSRFAGVYLQDGTVISLPDSLQQHWPAGGREGQQAGLRVQVRMQMQTGQIVGMWLQPSKEAEQSGEAIHTPVPVGSLSVTDTAYFPLAKMREYRQTKRYFLTQAKASVQLRDGRGVWRDLLSFLREQPEGDVDVEVVMGKREQVPVRLIAVRITKQQAAQRRARASASITHPPKGCQARRVGERKPKAQRQGKQKRKKVSQARLRLADWTILLTNVPSEYLSVDEALVLARYRWQIELYWKLCKQDSQVDTWRSHNPDRVETELLAKLLGVLITHWATLLGCWSEPSHSLVKAKQVVVWMTPCIALAMAGLVSLEVVLQRTASMMDGPGCRVDTRCHRPNAGQLIQQPTLIRGLG